jgi:hypothetical protein
MESRAGDDSSAARHGLFDSGAGNYQIENPLSAKRKPEIPTKKAQTITIKAPPILLAAGAVKQKIKATYLVTKDSEMISIRPLLYPSAKTVEAVAMRPDGTAEVLIAAADYRFNWQPSYYYKNPVALPAGTKIEVMAYLENEEEKPLRVRQALCELVIAQQVR